MNLQELNLNELTSVNGGDGIIGDIVDLLKELDANWDNLKCRVEDGWDAYDCER